MKIYTLYNPSFSFNFFSASQVTKRRGFASLPRWEARPLLVGISCHPPADARPTTDHRTEQSSQEKGRRSYGQRTPGDPDRDPTDTGETVRRYSTGERSQQTVVTPSVRPRSKTRSESTKEAGAAIQSRQQVYSKRFNICE